MTQSLSSESQAAPVPTVEAPCVVCGASGHRVVCPAREIEAHHRYLERFHKRRLHLDPKAGREDSASEDRIDFTQDYATDIVSCLSCGLIFRDPRPTKEAVLAAYAADRYEREHLLTAFWTHLVLSRRKARTMAQWLPQRPGVRVVEVGSFIGAFLAAGKEQGWTMLGVDPGEQAVAFCKEQGLPVVRGTLPDLRLAPASVDCVAIWNTFDQLPDPRPTLQAACDALRPGGLLAIRVPNGACFARGMTWERRLPRWASGWVRAALAWNNLLMFPYLIGYSVATADRLMGRYGMRRIAVQPDTLVNLADPGLKWWAVQEERLVKLVCRMVSRTESVWRGTSVTAPWLDLFYRKPASPR